MIDSVRFERLHRIDLRSSSNEANMAEESFPTPVPEHSVLDISTGSTVSDEPQGTSKLICSHDGVLLKKGTAEFLNELNTSGSLSIIEYSSPRRVYIEWRPNESFVIADDVQDQNEWSLVDTITRRTRTASECKTFNTKPSKPRVMRTNLDSLAFIEVKHRSQVIRLIKSNGGVRSEYFFQHANAEQFINAMRQQHIIVLSTTSHVHNGEVYDILTDEGQKVHKTFAELDIGEIKSSTLGNESWFQKFGSFADFVAPNRALSKSRPGSLESYDLIGQNDANAMGMSSARVTPESPVDGLEMENKKEHNMKIIADLPERQQVKRGAPLSEAQWNSFRTPDGCLNNPERIKDIIFRGGVEHNLRSEVWKYLLNYNRWEDTAQERARRHQCKSNEYYTMKTQWKTITPTQEQNFSGYRDRKCQIEKDVKRTDRTLDFFAGDGNPNLALLQDILLTYVMYNFDLGYVQGMSDLLAPILAVQVNEVDAFWCFVGFMDKVFSNFEMEQKAIKVQFEQICQLMDFVNPRLFYHLQSHDSGNLYFCFRWLIVWFKREFSNDDVLRLWEVLWTGLPCQNFQLFISLAILDQETDELIENHYEFATILKHVNELTGKINLKRTLEIAEAIYLQIKESQYKTNAIRAIIGEPLLDESGGSIELQHPDSDDEIFDNLTANEALQQRDIEHAFERSIDLNYT